MFQLGGGKEGLCSPKAPKHPTPKGGGIPKVEGYLEVAKSVRNERCDMVREAFHDFA